LASADQERAPTLSAGRLPSRKSIPPFEALRAFDAVARLGGVRKAAEYLCRDHAVISRHLRTIEKWTGTRLIERTPAGAVLTADGVRYHRQIAEAIDAIANATIDLMKVGDDRRLEIWCMPGLAFHWLIERLGAFENANPKLDIELRPTDMGPDFNRHEADIDIRLAVNYGAPLQLPPSVRSVEVATPPTIAVASPAYLARMPPIRAVGDFLRHDLLHEESFDCWGMWLSLHGLHQEVDLSGPRLWHAHMTLDAARRGRGIALSNHFVAGDDVAAGRLVEIGGTTGRFSSVAVGTYLFIARQDRWDTAAVARFRDWLLRAIAAHEQRTVKAGNS
jgi:LysR family glycine cleavage system transcriptional activator